MAAPNLDLKFGSRLVGILASLAFPNFSRFMAKARQAEGKTNIYTIKGLQTAFHAEQSYYGNYEDIGFSVTCVTFACSNTGGSARRKDCNTVSVSDKARYSYGMYTFATAGVERYWAWAQAPKTAINPSSNCRFDYWRIGEQLEHPTNWYTRADCAVD